MENSNCETGSSALRFVNASDPQIKYFGRWDLSDSSQALHSWPGVYLIVKFTGARIGIRIADDVNYYNVFIDDKLLKILHGNRPGATDYIIADNLNNGPHILRLSKRNISFGKSFAFLGVLIDKDAELLLPDQESGPKIEFIGDSFTAAEGNEAVLSEMPWEAKMPVTNLDSGFAALVADHFRAQYHTICRSGMGMVCDWTGDREIAMPEWYTQTLMEAEEPKWDFRKWRPDLVVICLGLNDMSGLKNTDGTISAPNSDLFRAKYRGFLERIRSVYPNVKILLVAAHPDWIRQNVQQIVAAEKTVGRQDIFYAEFDYFPGGYVADGHPTVATHRKIAGQIIKAIASNNLLK